MTYVTKKKQGMTLVELIIVIAIILLLVAIITPVVFRARKGARIVQSSSRLRQLYMSLEMYRADYDGKETYSSFYGMGLAPRSYFDQTHFGFSSSFWASPCGPDETIHNSGPSTVYGWITYVAPFYDPINITATTNTNYKDYLVTYQQNAVVFVDPYCNEPGIPLRAPLTKKRALAVLISGQLVNKQKQGDAFWLQFYSEVP